MANTGTVPEAWLRGPVQGIAPELQPVAHALIQAQDDAAQAARRLSIGQLWLRPGGAASVGFHLRHIAGVIDRLFTYARGEELSPAQFAVLEAEREPGEPPSAAEALLEALAATVAAALTQLRGTPAEELGEGRGVGRLKLPSNVRGLLFHAAEHAQRHTGQIVATSRIIRGMGLPG